VADYLCTKLSIACVRRGLQSAIKERPGLYKVSHIDDNATLLDWRAKLEGMIGGHPHAARWSDKCCRWPECAPMRRTYCCTTASRLS
jgi:hypothetical protein